MRTTEELQKHEALFERQYQYLRSELEAHKLQYAKNDEARKQEIHRLNVEIKKANIARWGKRERYNALWVLPMQVVALLIASLIASLIALGSIANAFF